MDNVFEESIVVESIANIHEPYIRIVHVQVVLGIEIIFIEKLAHVL